MLFDDVTPLGSHRLEMHVRTGRALHASCKRDLDRPATDSSWRSSSSIRARARGCSTSRRSCRPRRYRTPDEWEARIAQARATFGKD